MKSDWAFIEHVTNHLEHPKRSGQKQPTFWPSEASAELTNKYGEKYVVGKCRRSIFFRYLLDSYKFYSHFNTNKYAPWAPLVEDIKLKSAPVDKYLRWIWKAGEQYEETLIDLAKESGVFIQDQVPIYIPVYNVSGKIDMVTINPETGLYSNVEVKSVYGFGGNAVLGTPAQRKNGQLGAPRESNLMQIALYEWWDGSKANENYEESRLVYGSRDTGRYAEYRITTETVDEPDGTSDGQSYIHYQGIAPFVQPTKTRTEISIENILSQYSNVQNAVDGGFIPDRDYELEYSQEKIQTLYERDELSKTDKERHEKYVEYKAGNRRKIAPVQKGDWQCKLCKFRHLCYDENNTPITDI